MTPEAKQLLRVAIKVADRRGQKDIADLMRLTLNEANRCLPVVALTPASERKAGADAGAPSRLRAFA